MEKPVAPPDALSMKKSGVSACGILCVACILAAPPPNSVAQILDLSPAPSEQPTNTLPASNPGILVHDLIGYRVQSGRGDELGTVNDLLIDFSLGRVDYVLVASGGFAKIGRRLRPVPPNLLSAATAKRGVLSIDIKPELWKTAPAFGKGALADLGDPSVARLVYEFYQQKWPLQAIPSADKAIPLPPKNRLLFGSDLVGRQLLDRAGRKIARVSDLLLDLANPQAAFAIIKPEVPIAIPERLPPRQRFAVPIQELFSVGGQKLVLEVTTLQFEQARPFENSSWNAVPLTGNPVVFRYVPEETPRALPASVISRQ